MKRGIALDGVPSPDPVPFEAIKAAFMDRRWRQVRGIHDQNTQTTLTEFCAGGEHFAVVERPGYENVVHLMGPCTCKRKDYAATWGATW